VVAAAALAAAAAASGCRDQAAAPVTTPAGGGAASDGSVAGPANPTSAAEPSSASAGGSPGAAASSAPAAAPGPFSPEKVTDEGHAMGTHLSFAAFTTPGIDAAHVHGAFAAAIAEIVRIEKIMTTWDPASEVSRVNAAAGGGAVPVGGETFTVIAEAQHSSESSGGCFDITFETMHGLWKFDQDLDPHPPSAKDVRDRLKYVGYRHVHLDPGAQTVRIDDPHVRISLGGIAKGYAVDRASKVLQDAGLTAFYVQAGGDLYTHGTKPDGSPWMAGIRDPRGPEGDYFALMPVVDHAFSTAGDYERSYIVDGKRYHHIIDPRTGYPATASRSVTIWAPTALQADAVDDAVFILGPEKGRALVESLDGVGAVIVDAKNRVWTSKRLEGKVRGVHEPHDGI
jgi:thiamine biosynthesis lipoprotein